MHVNRRVVRRSHAPALRRTVDRLTAAALFSIPLVFCWPPSLEAAQSVTLILERAASPSGPWSRIDLDSVPRDPDGNPRLPIEKPGEVYRTRIELSDTIELGDPLLIEEVPPAFTSRARSLLERIAKLEVDGPTSDPEGWPEGAQLGPHVFPQLIVAGDGSVRPAYLEYKVLLPAVAPPERGGPVATDPEAGAPVDLGYILVSTSDDDFPIAEFATEGPTPCERMARLAGTPRIQVLRYGPTFMAAEDALGNLLATDGAIPFRLDPDLLAIDGAEWRGDSESGLDTSPPRLPNLDMDHYRTYEEFKDDFAHGEVYRAYRAIRKARAAPEWDIINGRPPQGVTVRVGQSTRVLTELAPVPSPEFQFITESDATVARISPSTQGGILVTGVALGNGLLRVRQGENEFVLAVKVTFGIAPQVVGDIIESRTFYAGDWGMQPRYHQLRRERWCDLVGCGPVAWAMLFAWFDRNWGVEEAFRGEGGNTSPPPNLSTQSNRTKVIPIYDTLHELCDVICSAGSDEGGTYPTDMTDAFKAYTLFPASTQQIGREWHINSITGTWPDAGALRCRDAIKNHYPAVTGLGWLWHYVLAYGYSYEIIDLGNGYTLTRRYLKCNMGWNGAGPRWYNMADTFYAADCRLWSGPNAP